MNRTLKEKLEQDLLFGGWVKLHWYAVYKDIKEETHKYPYWQEHIEEFYAEAQQAISEEGR